MSEELERLRADLEAVNNIRIRYQSDIKLSEIRDDLYDKIARLEAEQADPWREAKEAADLHIVNGGHKVKEVARWAMHLQAENIHLAAECDRLAARVAELEEEIKAEDDAGIADAEKALAEMVQANQDMGLYNAVGNPMVDDGDIPASWPPGKPDDPILDPKRIAATMARIVKGWRPDDHRLIEELEFLAAINEGDSAKPYRLKGGENGS